MIIVLNGPLGIGKSTLAEALAESIDGCVMLDGDSLVAANPPYSDDMEHLHATVELLIAHHRRFGYRHFVLDHIWRSSAEVDELRRRLAPLDPDVRVFLLTLPAGENLRRIERRAAAREIDELEWERRVVAEEREALDAGAEGVLGEPFDVSEPPAALARTMLRLLRVQA